MKKSILLTLITLSFFAASAQSMFSSIPKPDHRDKISFDTTITGPSWYGFRFTGPMVLVAFPTSTVFTGIGVDYEHDVLNVTTNKYYTQWAVGVGAYEGGVIAPSNISAVTAVGIHVAFFNKLVTVGALYNFQNKIIQGAAGPGVALNN